MEDWLVLRVMFTGGFSRYVLRFSDSLTDTLSGLSDGKREMNLIFFPHDILPQAFAFGDGGTQLVR
jgi:hypothetical protein